MDLDDYIISGAAVADDAVILRRFHDAEVFFSLPSGMSALESTPGEYITGSRMELQTANLDAGKMALFYVSSADARLGDTFAGIPLALAARLVCNEQGMDGMLLQSSSDAWICFPKQKLREIVGQLRDRVTYKEFR